MKNAIFMCLESICPYTTSSYYVGQKIEFHFHRKSGHRKQEDMITDKKNKPTKDQNKNLAKRDTF